MPCSPSVALFKQSQCHDCWSWMGGFQSRRIPLFRDGFQAPSGFLAWNRGRGEATLARPPRPGPNGRIRRQIALPVLVDRDQMEASCSSGAPRISLNKAAGAKSKRAPVTGMRRDEILGLKWSDVDIAGRVITIHQGKS